MKKVLSILVIALLALGLAACGNAESPASNEDAQTITADSSQEEKTENNDEEQAGQAETTESTSEVPGMTTEGMSSETEGTSSEAKTAGTSSEAETNGAQNKSDVLVVYFSATGTTKGVAEKIADITGADIYEIKAAQEYPEADLDWNDENSRTTKEQNDPAVRPEIGSEPISLDGYKTIYIGYPIWWGEEPRIMDTFVESCSFDGKTVIPFCTSGGSGIGRSGQNLADHAGSGTWLDGERFGAGTSEDEVRSWIEGLQ